MTSSDFVVTLYSFGLEGNPTKLGSLCLHVIPYVYLLLFQETPDGTASWRYRTGF
ncbi:hypothetical protein Rmet_6546 [Cupriavidus metallidurans CH34]|uniref:Uncharacterized protein n=1 Tax=Cupriavidus metallidurans (strain ATCC 43123 / DSM 2839 / NBRC 102507 / CH34) TaxID=266264 RepID=D3DXY3_CUPMC|nr:hypothetical protein Rmet_6546 [Cupriavidus metallidurans CH34]